MTKTATIQKLVKETQTMRTGAPLRRLHSHQLIPHPGAGARHHRGSKPMSTSAQITDARQALTYLYAGNATVTLVSRKTGNRFTYKIRAPETRSSRRFVGLLSGPDNDASYTYMGLLEHDEISDSFRLFRTAKSRVGPDAPSWKALKWTIEKLCRHEIPEALEFWHSGRCGRCGRTLTVPESIASGLGPVCASRYE